MKPSETLTGHEGSFPARPGLVALALVAFIPVRS